MILICDFVGMRDVVTGICDDTTVLSSYTEKANVYDKSMIDRWKGDMDGILIFVSFSFGDRLSK